MDENRIGSIYLDGRMLTSVGDIAFAEEVYDPEENTLRYIGIKNIEHQEITFKITCNAHRFRKMFVKCFMGWKNFDRPRKRTKEKAIKLMYRNIGFMSEERARRLWKRYQKKRRMQRRRAAGGGA